MKSFVIVAMICFIFLLAGVSFAEVSKSSCIECHEKVSPGIVKQFLDGKMAQAGIVCSACHGTDHNKMDDSKLARMPTLEDCARCHKKQSEQFKKGKHNLAWIASSSVTLLAHKPRPVTAKGYEWCSGCHKIGAKTESEKKLYRYGHAQCDSCHTRHSFKKSEALDPRACQTCHMGFDHPQWEMWSSSKHGAIWQIEGKESKRAPTCQTCHMQDGDHEVMTPWGFLGLRLQEDDKEWMALRTIILQALGVLDDKGDPTDRLEVVKMAKSARMTNEEFRKERDKMVKVCSKCHGPSYVKKQLESGDKVIKDTDRVMAEAIGIVKGLYRDGILKKPETWAFAPDLLNSYEAAPIEKDLYVMFIEYRMRAFEGAFHMNPDFMHSYGWAPMQEMLKKIKDEDRKLRAAKIPVNK